MSLKDFFGLKAKRAPSPELPKDERHDFYAAAKCGDRAAVAAFLAEHGTDAIDARDGNGNTALILAALNGSEDTITLLLEKGADVNARGNGGNTALIFAAVRDNDKIIALLRDNGADIDAKSAGGYTALIVAAHWSKKSAVAVLLEKGACIDVEDKSGKTALMWAAWNNDKDMALALLERGAALKNKSGDTALGLTDRHGRNCETRAVLEQWPDILKQRAEDAERQQLAEDLAAIERVFNGGFSKPKSYKKTFKP